MDNIKKKNTPLVSVILPNYNNDKYLDKSINSVIAQTFINWELFIIDDASSDNSLKIIDKYKNKENITILILKKNKGVSFCRNLGMRLSRGKYIAFLDSDDFWTNNKLDGQIKFMSTKGYQFSFSDYFSFKDEDYKKTKQTSITRKFCFDSFIKNTSINTSTMILEKKIVANLKFPKLKLLEDYIFKCKILQKGHFAYKYEQITAAYRIQKKTRSSNLLKNFFFLVYYNHKINRLSMLKNLCAVINVFINSLKKYGLLKYF